VINNVPAVNKLNIETKTNNPNVKEFHRQHPLDMVSKVCT